MNLLVVDTSSKEIAVAVFNGSKCLYENYITVDKNYNKVLMPILQNALAKAGLDLNEIDIFASTLGPGSFTGIRVGMAALKGLAQPVNKKYSGAVVLDILANSSESKGRVWAILDAGRGEFYAAVYKHKDNIQVLTGNYMLLSNELFQKKLKKGDIIVFLKRETFIIEMLKTEHEVKYEGLEHIDMKIFAKIILRRAKIIKAIDLFNAAPVYIRPSEAEATLKRNKKQKPTR